MPRVTFKATANAKEELPVTGYININWNDFYRQQIQSLMPHIEPHPLTFNTCAGTRQIICDYDEQGRPTPRVVERPSVASFTNYGVWTLGGGSGRAFGVDSRGIPYPVVDNELRVTTLNQDVTPSIIDDENDPQKEYYR